MPPVPPNDSASTPPAKAVDDLIPIIYEKLRSIAAACLRDERSAHTLQPTALVHEAYLRLVRSGALPTSDRGHFLAIAARCIRQILVGHARERQAAKRGGGTPPLTLHEHALPVRGARPVEIIDLEEALEELGRRDERQCRVVELRFYGGLSVEECAEVLSVSPRTVESDWAFARAWLAARLSPAD